jgi:hypothetical protein
MRPLAALCVALLISAPLAAQIPRPVPAGSAPARDAVGPAPTGTGRIRGRVVQAGTTTPVRRAQVTLTGEQNLSRIVTTDGDGRYEISELPAGRFTLTVAKGGYVTTAYGQRRSFEPGRPVVLADSQTLNQIDVGLPRGGVIVGRVLDRSGEPAIGAEIAVERYQYGPDGQRRLTRVATGAVATDDRGAFRAFGLTPGEYVVSANVRQGPQLPGTVATGAPVVGNLRTYFPGTPNAADAQAIVLDGGEEASVQFSMVSGTLATVSGTILDSSGRPGVGADIMLTTPTPAGGGSGRGVGSAGAEGTFSIARVPPGEHFVQVRLNPRPGGVTEPEVANVPVSASGANIEGLQIMTAAAVVASGRVEWEGEAPRTGAPTALRLTATPADGRPGLLGLIGAADPNATGGVAADGSFRIGGLSGTVRFAPTGVPPRWALKAIFAGREDVTDASVEAASLAGVPLRVVLTDKTTEVTGAVRDANGAPVAEFVVVVLPEQPLDAAVATRYTRAIRADQKGTFQIRGLPAGRYIVTAVPGLEPGSEWDPAFQASVRNGARRFTLEDGQSLSLTVDLLQ